MKKPSTLLRSLSTRLSARLAPSPAVAPWPPVRSAYDRWLAAELDELRADPIAPCTSAAWLGRAIGLAVAAQRQLVASASAAPAAGIDRKTIDECVEDTVELLDACAGLRGRLDLIRSYASSMCIALHWLEGRGEGATARRRAAAAFAECEAVERRCGAELAKCGSNLRKLGERALHTRHPSGGRAQCEESLAGARATALLAVGALGVALAFRSRRAVPGIAHAGGGKGGAVPWECALQEVQKHVKDEYERRRKEGVPCMAELDAAAADGRTVKSALTTGGRHLSETAVAAAKRRCDELEDKVSVLEESIGELHRELISVRMVLLEWSQSARGHEVLRL
ncbi:hypothetical protein CFC21_056847 [Triticum aestivum]|uniref:Uncharacterized protein n=3 Tax=Triticum TaxID=4564 RepID=A0A9R0WA32_TRITD|nr:hypothetical protein CFC21_056847 [Triticum aestivum]VAI02896.1 unnamed protein product [Triticum turgidum subsp. durum]